MVAAFFGGMFVGIVVAVGTAAGVALWLVKRHFDNEQDLLDYGHDPRTSGGIR